MDIGKDSGTVNKAIEAIKDAMFFKNGASKHPQISRLIIIKDNKIANITRKQIKKNLLKNLISLKEKR